MTIFTIAGPVVPYFLPLEPQVDWRPNALRPIRQLHFLSRSRRVIAGVENLLHDPAVLTGGLGLFFATNASGEVPHFLRKSPLRQEPD